MSLLGVREDALLVFVSSIAFSGHFLKLERRYFLQERCWPADLAESSFELLVFSHVLSCQELFVKGVAPLRDVHSVRGPGDAFQGFLAAKLRKYSSHGTEETGGWPMLIAPD